MARKAGLDPGGAGGFACAPPAPSFYILER